MRQTTVMKSSVLAGFVIMLAMCGFGCASTHGASASGASDAHADALKALHGFYAAEEKLFQGEMAPMERVWSRRDDITYLSPSGRFNVGWTEVMDDWSDQARLRLGGTIKPQNIHVFADARSNLAIVQNDEHATGQTIDGRKTSVHIRATNVFRMERGRWMMVSHHTDIIPGLAGD